MVGEGQILGGAQTPNLKKSRKELVCERSANVLPPSHGNRRLRPLVNESWPVDLDPFVVISQTLRLVSQKRLPSEAGILLFIVRCPFREEHLAVC